jgi:hypothetical protein
MATAFLVKMPMLIGEVKLTGGEHVSDNSFSARCTPRDRVASSGR